MTSPAFTQLTFRGRNDDGSESGATWKATQGTDWTQDTGVNFRVRFRIDETASRSWSNKTWNLYYQRNSGGYSAVGASTPVQFSLSSNFADGDDCTSQLTGGTGTFVTDNNGMKETTGGATNTGSAGYLFEVEFCLILDQAQLTDTDTINLRIYDGSSAIAAYTDTPVITVNFVAQNINETATLAVTNKAITSLSEVNLLDITSLAKYKGIDVQLGINSQEAASVEKYKGISTQTELNGQEIASVEKYKGINALDQIDGNELVNNFINSLAMVPSNFLTVEETLYGE